MKYEGLELLESYITPDCDLLDGLSRWETFLQVLLALAKPALAPQGILSFMGAWNNFIATAKGVKFTGNK